jgi:hypothetical protein
VYIGDLGTAGLYTFPNPLDSKVPPGALVQADNVVVSADGVVASRRGITFIGSAIGLASDQFIDSLFEYQNGWIAHASDDSLYFSTSLTNPSWTIYSVSETFAPPPGQVRLRGGEANKNFYLTTSNGIYKQDAINHTCRSRPACLRLWAARRRLGRRIGFPAASGADRLPDHLELYRRQREPDRRRALLPDPVINSTAEQFQRDA